MRLDAVIHKTSKGRGSRNIKVEVGTSMNRVGIVVDMGDVKWDQTLNNWYNHGRQWQSGACVRSQIASSRSFCLQ